MGKFRETVLIVEDDKTLLSVAVELFEAMGYETLTAGDALKALNLLEMQQIDVIFSDVVLPKGLNGVELVERAKQLHPDIKILLASGYPFDKIEHDSALDENSFVSKPYRVAQLQAKLEALAHKTH